MTVVAKREIVGYWLKAYRTCVDIALDHAFWVQERPGTPWEEWVVYWMEAAEEAEREVVLAILDPLTA